MCRLMGYLGQPVLVQEALYQFQNSLVSQSLKACESKFVVNGDGFGLGWYDFGIDSTPGLFRSIRPAWNDVNLKYLSKKLKVSNFIAHIRAATAGGVDTDNCHPFHLDRFLFAHNGNVDNFKKIRRTWQSQLDQDLYESINGQTDSEHIFALWFQEWRQQMAEYSLDAYAQALQHTLDRIARIQHAHALKSTSHINCVLSDGEQLMAMRYTNDHTQAPSLYYAKGLLRCENEIVSVHAQHPHQAVLIASEKMDDTSDWQEVPENHFVFVQKDLTISMKPIAPF